MDNVSIFIFLIIILSGIGYAVGNTRRFGIWKLMLVAGVMLPLVVQFNFGKTHIAVMLASFLVGVLLPYVHLLSSFSDAFSDAINTIRYKDAYEDIKRREEEVEALRRKYEQAQRDQANTEQEKERARRREQSQQYRHQQKQQSEQKKSSGKSKEQKQSSRQDSTRDKYLRVLGLDPNGNYSYKDIKTAYRRQASRHHPDKHAHQGDSTWEEMNKKFQQIAEAFEWLGAKV